VDPSGLLRTPKRCILAKSAQIVSTYLCADHARPSFSAAAVGIRRATHAASSSLRIDERQHPGYDCAMCVSCGRCSGCCGRRSRRTVARRQIAEPAHALDQPDRRSCPRELPRLLGLEITDDDDVEIAIRAAIGCSRRRPRQSCQSPRARSASQKKIERSRMKAPIQSSTIGIKGLTFKSSCDSSVAIAPAK
jgi:hypothetical protein